MFSWSTRFAPPTWCTKDPGATVNGQRKRDAVHATFNTRTANKARLHVNRAQTAETTSPRYESSRNKALPVAVRMETSVRATESTSRNEMCLLPVIGDVGSARSMQKR